MSGYGLGKANIDGGESNYNTRWCQFLWDSLEEGGTWSIPRTGLIFRKQNGRLRMIASMPYHPDMQMSMQELLEYQDGDFDSTKEQFGKIGVEVVRDV
jgi:hypothetical protein